MVMALEAPTTFFWQQCHDCFTVYYVDTANNVFTIYLNGMSKMTYYRAILAWSLGAIIDELETASNIAQLLDGNVPAFIIPD